jgi:hypothetical protein
MKKLLAAMSALIIQSCSLLSYADTPPQVINKTCSANQFFNKIAPGTGNITCLQPTYSGISNTPTFADSVQISSNIVTLVNDLLNPGNSKFYGTDSGGVRGFYDVPVAASSVGTIDSQTASANGGTIATNSLYFQSASVSNPGLVNNTTQSFSGNKTFTGTVGASNLSGTNTGDVTLGAVGSTPNANGASLSGQVLTIQPADGTNPGSLTAGAQSIGGAKTFTGAISASNLSGTNTGDISIGTANGLSLTGQVLSLGLSSTSTTGALSSTDWNTFNNKAVAGNYITALTGDVVATGPGSVSSTIQSNVVSNAKLAQMAANTIKGNNTAGLANASDLTVSQTNTLLGDVTTLGAVGAVPNANGASISGNTLNLQAADGTNPGALTAIAQNIGGAKNFLGQIQTGTPTTDAGASILVSNTGSGTDQKALSLQLAGTSAATGSVRGIQINLSTAASAFTAPQVLGVNIPAASAGAGSTITRAVGVLASPQTAGGTGNAEFSDNVAFSGNFVLNFSSSNASSFAGPITASQLNANSVQVGSAANTINGLSTIINTGTLTLPTSTDTLVGRATTDTLSNKTIASPTVTGVLKIADGTAGAPSLALSSDPTTGLHKATGTSIATSIGGSDVLTVNSGGTITTGSNQATSFVSTASNVASSGTVRLANADNIKFRNSGNSADIILGVGSSDAVASYAGIDLANISGSQTLTNKTISGSSNTLSNIADGSLSTSYVKADGTRNLTGDWGVGAFRMAIGTTSASGNSSYLDIGNNAAAAGILSSTNQQGIAVDYTVSSNATVGAEGVDSFVRTANTSFTVPVVSNFKADTISKGAASTITRSIQYEASGDLSAGTNNAQYSDNESFSGNWAFNLASTRANTFGGTMTAASFIPSSSTIPTNGLYLSAANEVSLATNSAQRFSIGSSGTMTANTTDLEVSNTSSVFARLISSGASQTAQFRLQTGATGGSAFITFQALASADWSIGEDASDGKFKIDNGASPGSNTRFSMTQAGVGTFSQGLQFATSGGTPSTLNYYEEGSFTALFNAGAGSGGSSNSFTVKFVRNGSVVTLSFPIMSGMTTGGSGSPAFSTASATIPTRIRPTVNQYGMDLASVSNAQPSSPGVYIVQSSGEIDLYREPTLAVNWPTNNANNGALAFSVTYTLN